ncbi:non-structural maintenance of chromosomes element 3 homolog [Thrips palmi]|uniref:Non-structural maintenance of chromosomes element 3 homolog n=1 Tax=Thrips palmi TaxID=161013 RepID=A0A6P8Z8A2_THRPL|nr:non-structural maintenance of chromosomes element 3 homolog [Thrips palmi]XP_034246671.1 non-structural maintenance of chromosomes element 3 homolog [Thrips palmi]XP_034246672.1 non-structural maintenance of chromosomes element 3 homolog [Thrips palmi]XP_034246673.1 non-structural maintenance of chromosomes element 3 homolog [Thrips palmi]XP_034246674.1 non-structural maintenance of chromosomes element 3 homolog [Thrips palmi]XP_034246675.1 non-structural maintenance of chromosomes element 
MSPRRSRGRGAGGSQGTPRSSQSQSSKSSQSRASQGSQGSRQGTPQPPRLGYDETKSLARLTVRFMLMQDFDKVPIKHSDILKNILKNTLKSAADVMPIAIKMLRDIYGIRVVDGGYRTKHYLLINSLKHQEHVSNSAAVQADLGLLAIILSLIFMQTNGRWKDAGIEQGKVITFLKSIGIDDDHEYFGNLKKNLKTYESQDYLDVVKIDNTDPVKYEYRWGIRACEELSPRDVLQFASEMYGRDSIESWSAHYKAVCAHERGGSE